jgi:hypothetical protein
LQERPLHFTVAKETTIMTRPRSQYILPAILVSVLAVLIFGDVGRFRVGVKVSNLTNQFNPRDFQGNLASDEFGGFYNGVGRKFGMKFVIEKK